MGNDADTEESNKYVRKNDTGHSLQQEECDEEETTPFDEDDERDSGMAVAHSSVISEDLVNTKARGYYDGKTVLVQANGTPEKKDDNEDHSGDDSDAMPEADNNDGNSAVLSTNNSVTNTQQESRWECEANRQLVVDQSITSTDYASQQSRLVSGSTTSLTITPADQSTRYCVVSNNGNSMEIVGDTLVLVYNVEILPPQDGSLLPLAEQPPQQPPPADQFNNPGVDPNDGNDGLEQAEDVHSPFIMNVVDPPQLMVPESPILPFQPQLPEGIHISDPEETGTEDDEQSESPSSDIFENIDDQVEYMELR